MLLHCRALTVDLSRCSGKSRRCGVRLFFPRQHQARRNLLATLATDVCFEIGQSVLEPVDSIRFLDAADRAGVVLRNTLQVSRHEHIGHALRRQFPADLYPRRAVQKLDVYEANSGEADPISPFGLSAASPTTS